MLSSSMTRLNKHLAHQGLCSRRAADKLIAQGKVLVNGQPAELGMQVDPQSDRIEVLDKVVPSQESNLTYWKLYKPIGVVSAVAKQPAAPDRPTIQDLLDQAGIQQRVYPVGRLDIASEGLLLLTNDGDLTLRLTHPKYQVPKKYLVWVNGDLSEYALRKLRRGVKLSDGLTAKTEVEVIFKEPERAKFSIVLREGRHRQIRRMAAQLGLHVTKLKRVKLGTVELEKLYPGEIVPLTKEELVGLKELVGLE